MNIFAPNRPPQAPQKYTMYCLGCIDTKTATYIGCTTFSEENPTTTFDRFYFFIAKADGKTLEEALAKLKKLLAGPHYKWALDTFKERSTIPPGTVVRGGRLPARHDHKYEAGSFKVCRRCGGAPH